MFTYLLPCFDDFILDRDRRIFSGLAYTFLLGFVLLEGMN